MPMSLDHGDCGTGATVVRPNGGLNAASFDVTVLKRETWWTASIHIKDVARRPSEAGARNQTS